MKKYVLLLGLLLALTSGFTVRAQGENDVWCFGLRAGLKFQKGSAVPTYLVSAIESFEACASVADASGNLLFYTDATSVWTRQHTLMANGTALGGSTSSSQGALIVRAVDSSQEYYIFTLDDKEHNLKAGLRYSLLHMGLQNGMGAVTQKNQPIALPGGKLPTEHLAAIPQPNGHDYWIVVHGFNTNEFYAYSLTKAGLAATPVISAVGAVFTSVTTAETGIMRFSPDGRRLAVTRLMGGLELFDFDVATGQLSNGVVVTAPAANTPILQGRMVGAEFSADGTLLYTHEGPNILQFDLLAGSPAAVRASRRRLGSIERPIGDFLRGSDGRIYIAALYESALSVIENPNQVLGARFLFRGQRLNAYVDPNSTMPPCSQYGLPNYRLNPVLATPEVEEAFRIVSAPGCVGSPSSFRVVGRDPQRTISRVTWTFAPDATVYSGLAIAPVFTQPGSRELLVVVEFTNGTRQSQRLTVSVPPNVSFRLRAENSTGSFACGEREVVLTAEATTPGTFHWADSPTTEPVRRITAPGLYRVRFESEAGCAALDSIVVAPPSGTCTLPNIITPNGDDANQRFVLTGYEAGHWAITVYNRWGRAVYEQVGYQNDWQADNQPAGVYYYQLRHLTTNERLKGWVEVVR
ncbi:gliding motility-associated C-terminal domain-containing protein [Hymenobacter lucidus]|uniref:Gliding motility-associated C-terminal domain-containing protein n=1 Tax=Hymenobacter lucidus TaxID=2880930 RepID=A0ABS8APA7_9BACT|nr:gliding motility-associated C-terminal domain-containing protein [Hymenobacter lucidus]MCB2407939.1 gliding motility-associated C-terminal domain-containing protein [Hymenobacter lucidus]